MESVLGGGFVEGRRFDGAVHVGGLFLVRRPEAGVLLRAQLEAERLPYLYLDGAKSTAIVRSVLAFLQSHLR